MNTSIVILVVFLVVVFALSFPTRRRAVSAYTPAAGPHPLLRPPDVAGGGLEHLVVEALRTRGEDDDVEALSGGQRTE